MKVAIVGLTHLGQVAAACLAEQDGFEVTAYSSEPVELVEEPDMPVAKYNLTEIAKVAITNADLIWLTIDTKLGEGTPDVQSTLLDADRALQWASNGQRVLVSCQLPVGTVGKMQDKYPHLKFFVSPENLRRGKAVVDFKNQARVIIGTADYQDETIARLFKPFCQNLFWCSIQSAEFVKHALNSWLAMNIAWANEMGNIAIKHGANPTAVTWAMRQEPRVGEGAPISYAKGGIGPHLQRDLTYLLELAPEANLLRGVQRASDDWEAGRGN